MRPENTRMQEFLKSHGVVARVKYIKDGSLKHTWRLYNPGIKWSQDMADTINALGFVSYDGNPLGQYEGNGGIFSVFVRRHNDLL